jgi:hypothetical protein
MVSRRQGGFDIELPTIIHVMERFMSIDAMVDVSILRTPIFFGNGLSNQWLSAYNMIDTGSLHLATMI